MQTIPPETPLFQRLRLDLGYVSGADESAVLFPTIVSSDDNSARGVAANNGGSNGVGPLYHAADDGCACILNEDFVEPGRVTTSESGGNGIFAIFGLWRRLKRRISSLFGLHAHSKRVGIGRSLSTASGYLTAFAQVGSARIRIVFNRPGVCLDASIFTGSSPVTSLCFAGVNKLVVGTPGGLLIFSIAVDEAVRTAKGNGCVFVTGVSAVPLACGPSGYVSPARCSLAQRVARRLLCIQRRLALATLAGPQSERSFIEHSLNDLFPLNNSNLINSNNSSDNIGNIDNVEEINDTTDNNMADLEGDDLALFNALSLASAVSGPVQSPARAMGSVFVPTCLSSSENGRILCVASALETTTEAAHVVDLATCSAVGVKLPINGSSNPKLPLIARPFAGITDFITCCSMTTNGELISFGLDSGAVVVYDTITARHATLSPVEIPAFRSKSHTRRHSKKRDSNNNTMNSTVNNNVTLDDIVKEDDDDYQNVAEFTEQTAVSVIAFLKTTTTPPQQTLGVLECLWSDLADAQARRNHYNGKRAARMQIQGLEEVTASLSELSNIDSRVADSNAATAVGLGNTIGRNNLNDSLFGSLTDGNLCCADGGKLMVATSRYRAEKLQASAQIMTTTLGNENVAQQENEPPRGGLFMNYSNGFTALADDGAATQIGQEEDVIDKLIMQDCDNFYNNNNNNSNNQMQPNLINQEGYNSNDNSNNNLIPVHIGTQKQTQRFNLMCPEIGKQKNQNTFLLAVAIGAKVHFLEIEITKFARQASWMLPITHLNSIDVSPVKVFVRTSMAEQARAYQQGLRVAANFAESRIIGGNVTDLAWKDGLLAIATVYEDMANSVYDASVVLSTSLRSGTASDKISTITQGAILPNKTKYIIDPNSLQQEVEGKIATFVYSKYRLSNHISVALSDFLSVMIGNDGMVFDV